MDALGDVLDGVRARSASFCRVELHPPWALRIADEAPLGLATTVRGEAWIVPGDMDPVHVPPGAVAVVKGPAPYTVGHDPAAEPDLVVGPGNVLNSPDGRELPPDALDATGGDPDRATVVASGTYQVSGDVGSRLLDALPRVLIVHADREATESAGPGPALHLLSDELASTAPAQQVMLDRLLDIALIETLRAWFAQPDTTPPGWYAAHADPVVGPALRLVHGDPARQWTLGELARQVGASRATLARRFRDVVGEPPATYLTNWRITLAADLLRSSDLTVDAIARRVGYANGFALSVAFERVRGVRPSVHRSGARSPTVVTPAPAPAAPG
jgi:AraC-like DNA-binding protein